MSGTDYTTTPNLALYKPIFDMAVGQWGDLWNSNADKLDSVIHGMGGGPFLPLSGGAVTGQTSFYQSTTGDFPQLLTVHGSLHGQPAQSGTNFSQVAVDADSADANASGGPGGVNYLYVGGTMQPGFTGNRSGVNSFMYVHGTPGAHSVTNFATALVGWTVCDVPDNGHNNSIFGGNLLVDLHSGATGWGGLVGLEVDVNARAGSSVNLKEGFKVVLGGEDVNQGTSTDAAIALAMTGAAPGTGGWKVGFSFGSATGVWPFQTTGTLIGTTPTGLGGRAYAAATGIDFSAVSFSEAAFRSPNYTVTGLGGVNFTGTAASATDLSHHIDLTGAGAEGINTYGGNMYLNVGGGAAILFVSSGVNMGYMNSTGLNGMPVGQQGSAAGTFTTAQIGGNTGPTWTTGSTAPAATAPVGSLYSRVGGAVGATLYVSRGAGTWAAVAGV